MLGGKVAHCPEPRRLATHAQETGSVMAPCSRLQSHVPIIVLLPQVAVSPAAQISPNLHVFVSFVLVFFVCLNPSLPLTS